MTYNFKRALGISFALYVATFIVGIIVGVAAGSDMSSMENISDSFWYYGMVTAVVLTALCAAWYFKNSAIVPSRLSGFYFGATAVVLSFLLDLGLFSLGNAGGANVDLG
jgi:hypothetical protein